MLFIKIRKLLLLFKTVTLLMLLANTSFSQTNRIPKDWNKNEMSLFSFYAPADLASKPFKGKDSEVWKYESQNLQLVIDLGLYSGKPEKDINESNYMEKSVKVDGKKATTVFSEFSDSNSEECKYVAAVYFPRIGSDETKLSFVIHSKTPEGQKIAEKIFRSIKFKSQKK